MRYFILFLPLLVLWAASVQAVNDRALFWRVQAGNATVYLLGSIHYADGSFYPLRDEIERAFYISDHLVVEINIDEQKAMRYRDLIREKGSYHGDKTIRDEISEETYRQLEYRLNHLGLPIQMVHKQKPGVLVLTLTAVQVMKMGFMPDLGIDAYFLRKASNTGKNIIELETVDEQLDVFLNITDGDLLLREALFSLHEAEMMMMDMIFCWKRGDEACLEGLLFEDALTSYPSFVNIYDILFFRRNEDMANDIKTFLDSSGTYFVVIGAGHLVGDRGIPNLLKKAGYEVRRL
ncbi:MAG: TraB/GumN family protein [Thiotrichales bacterium]|nr:MAG: TraB/GumN family protein [Thiotrichales bacterium]